MRCAATGRYGNLKARTSMPVSRTRLRALPRRRRIAANLMSSPLQSHTPSMPRTTALIYGGVIVTVALTAALAFHSVYRISIRPRPPDPVLSMPAAARLPAADQPLPLRLVDSGGVGIPLAG